MNTKKICTLCDFKTKTTFMMDKHMKEHRNTIKTKNLCSICGWEGNTKIQLQHHTEKHNAGINNANVNNVNINNVNNAYVNNVSNVDIVDINNVNINVSNVNNAYVNNANIKNTKKRIRNKCPLCDYVAPNGYLKDKHVRLLHTKPTKQLNLIDGIDTISNILALGVFFY